MPVSLKKVVPKYNGYKDNSVIYKAVTKTLYSRYKRYPEQISAIKNIFRTSDKKTQMMIIGVSQGQEPLTHIQNALEVAQEKGKNIDDILDLTLIEAAEQMPLFNLADKCANKASIDYLKKLYKDNSKVHFSTPFETIVKKMKKENSKKDVILFNNVIQHINYGENNEKEQDVIDSIKDLIDLTNENGLFCFTCEPMVLHDLPKVRDYYNKVVNILQNKGFIQIADGIYKKQDTTKIHQAQRVQILGIKPNH